MHFNLVFEGGGAKGLVFVGAMKEFERREYTYGRLLGTSAGAITAALLAANYTSSEMLKQVNEKMPDGTPRFASFMDVADTIDEKDWENSVLYNLFKQTDWPLIPEVVEERIDDKIFKQFMRLKASRLIFTFLELGGLYTGNTFLTWLREKLDLDGRNLGHATLAEFYEHTGKDLSVVASNTTDGGILVLNHRTAPNCPVAWAVRMSMSIPFVWEEVRWRKEWGLYHDRDVTGHAIVDGGLNSNFPIRLLIARSPDVTAVMGPHDGSFALGMLIDETKPVAGEIPIAEDTGSESALSIKSLPIVRRISNLVNTVTNAHDKTVMDAYKDGVCRLPAKGYGTTDFGMSDKRVAALVAAGEATAREFFDHFTLPKGTAKSNK
ncbi:MAG: patatin-like phospholipase family protein [Ardenticatenaceae bacterium]|nr:patatin-like phospholipase family protein [Anaerolineales bacterium]MCB8923246.1 patatin-like phospholipase family protein [Ardenticatenaceae bacterium]MCB9004809.1 patatin-like phospholipase family protein [Ardenticatenaceae bacterium]